MILLISVPQVARITGVSHRFLAGLLLLIILILDSILYIFPTFINSFNSHTIPLK
jgi:hypothetical protein